VTKARSLVIVLDDDPSVLRALRRLISGAGYDVQAFNCPSALLASGSFRADSCLVVDIHLPEMNGVELCEALAASGRSLPTIFITAHPDEHTMKLARRAQPVAVLIKPFARDLLLDSISAALNNKTPS
jgi:FixJ family two-component response regulator